MVRKEEITGALSKRTVNGILKWLFFCERVDNDWHRLTHEAKCDLIAARFDIAVLRTLAAEADRAPQGEIPETVLAGIIGLPRKIRMLEGMSVTDLDRLIVSVAPGLKRKLKKDKIQYLNGRFTREEIAAACGFTRLAPAPAPEPVGLPGIPEPPPQKESETAGQPIAYDSVFAAFNGLPVVCKIRKYVIRDISLLRKSGFRKDLETITDEFEHLEKRHNIRLGFPVNPVTGTSGTLRKNFAAALEHTVTILTYTGVGGGWTEDMWASFLMWYFPEPRAFISRRKQLGLSAGAC